MVFVYIALAILLMTSAHLIREKRWELFINIYEKPDTRRLTQSVSIVYFLNYIVPFKLGDLVRAIFAGRKMKNGMALSFSTVIIDRILDVICVGLIFVGLSIGGIGGDISSSTASFYGGLAFAMILLILLTALLRGPIKKCIRFLASIFNDSIEISLLQFSWALIWNFKDIFSKISKWKLLFSTFFIWILYFCSYFFLAGALTMQGFDANWTDLFLMFFGQDGFKQSTGALTMLVGSSAGTASIEMIAYSILPPIFLFLLSFCYKNVTELDLEEENYLNLLPHLDSGERLRFLESYFSNDNREYIHTYLKINQGIHIIRDYSAGSNATTMLCMDEKQTFFRKYAFGEDGEKLYQQILWLEENQDRLPLPQILRKEKTDYYCYYDMPYSASSVGLFEYSHSMPVDKAWNMIKQSLESLEESIYRINVRPADTHTIHLYIESKVTKNLEKIKKAKQLRNLQQYKTIYINGVEYRNLSYYEKYLNCDYLEKVFSHDIYAVIHGDLTIENIIARREENGMDDFYIIDPNTGNVHDSPNLDYGKLLQSIHGGYEFLMATKDVRVNENHINFLFTKSSAYIELHERLRGYMEENLGDDRTRSIYFHEIIHWLRLMPYKIEKDGKRALLFYAGMLMVMDDVIAMYGDLED